MSDEPFDNDATKQIDIDPRKLLDPRFLEEMGLADVLDRAPAADQAKTPVSGLAAVERAGEQAFRSGEVEVTTLDVDLPHALIAESFPELEDEPTFDFELQLHVDVEKLASNEEFDAVARADLQGNVLESAGDMATEVTCAMASMASHSLAEGLREVGLGELLGWCLSGAQRSWYTYQVDEELVVAVGGARKNPVAALIKLVTEAEG